MTNFVTHSVAFFAAAFITLVSMSAAIIVPPVQAASTVLPLLA